MKPLRPPRLKPNYIVNGALSAFLGGLLLYIVINQGATPNPSSAERDLSPRSTASPVQSTDTTYSVPPGPTLSKPSGTTETAAPAASVVAGQTLYQANWSTRPSEWGQSPDWRIVDGMAISVGNASYDAAYRLRFSPLYTLPPGDIVVEAEIQFDRVVEEAGTYKTFGVIARATADGGYAFGPCLNCRPSLLGLTSQGFEDPLVTVPYDPGSGWHTYRVEFNGAEIIASIDGHEALRVVDATYLDATGVGLWAAGSVVEVRSFEVRRP